MATCIIIRMNFFMRKKIMKYWNVSQLDGSQEENHVDDRLAGFSRDVALTFKYAPYIFWM